MPMPEAHFKTLGPFDLSIDACRVPAMEYICSKFGVDSSSRFSFIAHTKTQVCVCVCVCVTYVTDHPTHALYYCTEKCLLLKPIFRLFVTNI